MSFSKPPLQYKGQTGEAQARADGVNYRLTIQLKEYINCTAGHYTPGLKSDTEKAYKFLPGLWYTEGLRISQRDYKMPGTYEHTALQHLLTNAEISFLMQVKQQCWWLCPL